LPVSSDRYLSCYRSLALAAPYIADMEPSEMGTGERVGAATFFGAVTGGAAAGIAAAARPGEKKTVIYRSP